MDRRAFLGVAGLSLVGCRFARTSQASHHSQSSYVSPTRSFAEIEARLGGRVGVMALDTGDGFEISYRADERFAMCSTFKWLLAAFVLSRVDQGGIHLDELISYGSADLLEYAPVAKAHVDEGSLSVEAFCHAAVTVSDNTAANLLLERVGGPPELTAFLRRTGDTVTRLDRNEPELNTNIAGDERDTTTPRAMVGTMNRVLLGNVLSADSRDRLTRWLIETSTGLKRLRAGLPAGWVAGDKTGTGVNGAANDVAIVWPPDGKPILIASYLSESEATLEARDAAHAEIAAEIVTAIVARR